MSICICILKLGRVGECRRRPSAHTSACWLHDHIRKVTLSHKKTKMSETARAVGRERTTIIVAYIGFRPSWSSNVELILRSNQVVGEMKDIIYKCYRYRAETSRTHFVSRLMSVMIKWCHLGDQAGRTRRLQTWIIRSHGIKKEQITCINAFRLR